ncbi:MAG: sigma-70 family RNA polymerase sigma factor [Chloroflexota bacterium]|nr:sigma-70 family RNA polymerase sigma factor [Chloroflexota bacterium]
MDQQQQRNAEDEDLIARMAARDPTALAVLYDQYDRLVFSFVFHILNDAASAEEVTQDVFLRAWDAAGKFQVGRGRVSSWLLAIAHNRAIDELRSRRARGAKVTTSYDLATPGDLEQAFRSSLGGASQEATDPQEAALSGMRRARVMEALKLLPPEQSKVITLAYYGGFTHREIADRLQEPLGTVKTRLRLGLQKLRNLLAAEVQASEM